MDMVYYEKPVLLLFPILLLLWQVFCYRVKKKTPISSLADTALTGIGVVGHVAAISVILLNDGSLSDVLLLVLLSSAVALLLSPNPNKAENISAEEDNH